MAVCLKTPFVVLGYFDVAKEWERFKVAYNTTYSRAAELRRFQLFVENLKRAQALREADPYASYGVTHSRT
jgi:hypothetical protein